MPIPIASMVISDWFKETDISTFTKSLVDDAYNKNPELFDAWFKSFFMEYRGRFSDQTKIWPVPDNLVDVEYIIEVQSIYMYRDGNKSTNTARNYELIKELVSKKGTKDGAIFKASQNPQTNNTEDEEDIDFDDVPTIDDAKKDKKEAVPEPESKKTTPAIIAVALIAFLLLK